MRAWGRKVRVELDDERVSHLVPNYRTPVYSNMFSLVSSPLALWPSHYGSQRLATDILASIFHG